MRTAFLDQPITSANYALIQILVAQYISRALEPLIVITLDTVSNIIENTYI